MKKIIILCTCILCVLLTVILFTRTSKADDSTYISYVFVDVKGEVKAPGVYRVSISTRVFQVIEMAGGLTNLAYTRNVNLASKISDEQIIYIPSIDEQALETSTLININTASADLLATLPGIGPSLAAAIINYRSTISIFAKIEDIMNVSGIGSATFANIKAYITV